MRGSKVVATSTTRHRHLTSPQSKHGCYTCRARRKKCDEVKPRCERCARAGLACEGYRLNEDQEDTVMSLSRTLSPQPPTDHAHARFARLGQELLSRQVGPDALSVSATVWTEILPQLNVINSCVNAAITCLGSVYEALVLRQESDMSVVGLEYRKAISLLQREISSPAHGKTPIFLACVVLAAVEVLQRRLINAVLHLRGAFQVLTAYKHEMTNGEDLYRIAQALDIQTATYALGQPPDLPSSHYIASFSINRKLQRTSVLDDVHSELLPLLHACYHYCYTASEYKYVSPSRIPQLVILDQGRHIAFLSQWVARLDESLTSCPPISDHERLLPRNSRNILRLQCISAIVYLSSVLHPYEKGYDSYMSFFRQIISGAASILDPPRQLPEHLTARFQIISPLAQPLYFTALKCRNHHLRQEAIRLLSLTGREGPWESCILVRIASRIAQLEKNSCVYDDVPERSRIHGCGVISEGIPNIDRDAVEVQFSRCVDVGDMLVCPDWESHDNWEIWTEVLPKHDERQLPSSNLILSTTMDGE